jgi:hypothetical protein
VAIYHLSVKTVSRSSGRSAVAAAAYRSGIRLACERDGRMHDYTRKRGVVESFIVAPAGAEAWASDRSALWNLAEAAETRKNSTVAREYELALPAELPEGERVALARRFAETVVERFGVVADVALHEPHREGDQRNWHAHILTTTRAANENGLGGKTRQLDDRTTGPALVEGLREVWAEQVNAALERARVTARVDHRSFARQDAERGLDPRDRIRPPGVHLGPAATAIERRAARERVRGLSDDAGVMERHRAKQLRGASRRDAMREERSERHFEVAQARLEAREAVSEVVQLEAERERRMAAEAAQKATEAAQRATEQKAAEAAEYRTYYRGLVEEAEQAGDHMGAARRRGWLAAAIELLNEGERPPMHPKRLQEAGEAALNEWIEQDYRRRHPEEAVQEATPETAGDPTILAEQAKLNRWQAMSVDDLRAEIERIQPLGVSLRPGMMEADEARKEAEKAYQKAWNSLWSDQQALERLQEQGVSWRSQHPLRNLLHQSGVWKDRQYSDWQKQAENLIDRIEEAKPSVKSLKSAMDEAVQTAEDLAAEYRTDREQEMKAVEPDLKVLKDLLTEKQEEIWQAQRTQERGRGDEMEMDY